MLARQAFVYLKSLLKLVNILWAISCICAFYVIYFLYGDKPCDQEIAMFLLVSANISAFITFLLILLQIMPDNVTQSSSQRLPAGSQPNSSKGRFHSALLFFGMVFFIVWFALGNWWTFNTSPSTCNLQLYTAAFWYIISVYFWIGLHFFFTMLVVVCFPDVAAQASRDQDEDGAEEAGFVDAQAERKMQRRNALKQHHARLQQQRIIINKMVSNRHDNRVASDFQQEQQEQQKQREQQELAVTVDIDPLSLSRTERALYEQRHTRGQLHAKYLTFNMQ